MTITQYIVDKLWEYLVKGRAGWRCEICGSGSSGLHAAHIIGRGALWTRHRLRNGLGLCPICHVDSKIKAWLIAEAHKKDSKYRWRWRWVQKQRRIIHRGRGPDLRNEYRRLRSKEKAALKKAAA